MVASYLFYQFEGTNEDELFEKVHSKIASRTQPALFPLSFKKRKMGEEKLDYLQLNHLRALELMTNNEVKKFLARVGKFRTSVDVIIP